VVEERCQVISLLGGLEESALAVNLMIARVATPISGVMIWRSLQDAPSCERLLDECLSSWPATPWRQPQLTWDGGIWLFVWVFREPRILLVLDNLESVPR